MDYYYSNKEETPITNNLAALKLKVCGMNKNTAAVADLRPDYLGFIFWEPSKRNFEGDLPLIPHGVKKVGVFVDERIVIIAETVKKYDLLLVQLHGNENAAFCAQLKKQLPHIQIIKAFAVNDSFDFDALKPYEEVCDYYLFDTKGALPGGNGFAFDWQLLRSYPSTKPYFLSGGIGLNDFDAIKAFLKRPEAQYCHVIDVNSKFESEPGLKNTDKIKEFRDLLQSKDQLKKANK